MARAASSWCSPVKPDSVNVGGCERLAMAGMFVEYDTSAARIQQRNITNTQKNPNTISKFFADKQFEIYPDLSDC